MTSLIKPSQTPHPEESSASMSSADASFTCSDLDVLRATDECATVPILAELVGAAKLCSDDADDSTTDAMRVFAVIRFGDEVIHRTAKETGRNPIWSIGSRSIFLLQATPRELLANDLRVTLWTRKKDPLNLTTVETNFLGQAKLSCTTILEHCDEKRLELDLRDIGDYDDDHHRDHFESHNNSLGTITMRFRMATESDQAFLHFQQEEDRRQKESKTVVPQNAGEFLKTCTGMQTDQPSSATRLTKLPHELCRDSGRKRPQAKIVTEADETEVVGESFVNALSSAFTSRSYFDKQAGARKILVKPGPDPKRAAQTTYLTKQALAAETMAPSTNWVEAGGGGLGTLYLEILACHDLPNVDVGEAVGNVTDCFVAAVFEDAMVQTPVIDDELSPHFLPWTQRAFMFGVMHPASILYLGAFDYDLGISDHEPLGRVAVNISNFQRDTDYILKYNLYPSSNVTDRTANGSLTIRLRIEYDNEKEAILRALQPRPKFHVNVRKEKSLKIVHYACYGEYGDENDQKFDLTVMRSLVNEIFEYKSAVSYAIGDSLRSLIFWRGQVQFGKIYLPLHSVVFFSMATTLVERPYYAPSFFLLTVAWIMLALQNQRRQHPSPWHRCPSFWHYMQILKSGKSPLAVRRINPQEGAAAMQAYEQQWQERIDKDTKDAAAKAEMQQKIESMGDDTIHSKIAAGGIPLDILARLGRYQGMIGRYCQHFRFMKIILTWEEGIVSFWITACFLSAGLVSLLLPWRFILLWTGRIVVWGFMGPHMFLVDLYLSLYDDEQKNLKKALDKFNGERRLARYRKQDAVKLKDMKCLAFGEFVSLVPNFNLVRHHDNPLPGSYARVRHRDENYRAPKAKSFVPSQHFFGVMVPRTEIPAKEFELELPRIKALADEVRMQMDIIAKTEQEIKLKDSQGDDIPACIGFEITCDAHQKAEIYNTNSPDQVENLTNVVGTRELKVTRNNKDFGYELLGDKGSDGEADRQVSFRLATGTTLKIEPASNRAFLDVKENQDSTRELIADFIKMLESEDEDNVNLCAPSQEEGIEILMSSPEPVSVEADPLELSESTSDVFSGLDEEDTTKEDSQTATSDQDATATDESRDITDSEDTESESFQCAEEEQAGDEQRRNPSIASEDPVYALVYRK